jgi:uncharacterized protein YndB with AHSA1/START domain
VPSFSHSVEVSKPPGEVFAWLFDDDKVPQWTSRLERYERDGALGPGAKVRQVLDVAGGLTLDFEITGYDPPRTAGTSFTTNGVNLTSAYDLAPARQGGTRLTQTLDAKATSLTARMLIPVVQGRLEQKIKDDLERLRALLDG